MKSNTRLTSVIVLVLLAGICISACEKKQEGKVEVTEKQFMIRKDPGLNWVADATGKIRNTGKVDLKNVVVTGYCRSCGEILVAGVWYVSDYAKLPEQMDTINYLPAGGEEKFSFRDVAFYFDQTGLAPEKLPDQIEIVVESFEVVEK